MADFSFNATELAWPFIIAFAWLAGEFGHRWTQLPRISIYSLVGFLFAESQIGFLSHLDNRAILLLANIAFGLILFEFGYRINLRWLKVNSWVSIAGLVESFVTFIAVYGVAQWFGSPVLISLLLAALAMSTSPAGVMRVINEERSSGQVTERILHLSAINCVLAVVAFKVITAVWVFQTSGSMFYASANCLIVLFGSISIGAVFGLLLPVILRRLGKLSDATLAFECAVILLVMVVHVVKLSPILATLVFGLMARHRRVAFARTQRNFGVLGDLLTVMLFVFVSSTLKWSDVVTGASLGLALVIVRLGTKTLVTSAFSGVSGITWRKGVLSGLGLAPISVFVILTLEHTRYAGLALIDELAPLATATLLLEIIGPLITQRVLMWANETREIPNISKSTSN